MCVYIIYICIYILYIYIFNVIYIYTILYIFGYMGFMSKKLQFVANGQFFLLFITEDKFLTFIEFLNTKYDYVFMKSH